MVEFHDFPRPQSSSMTFHAWKISFLNFKTFHDFPGCVGTWNIATTYYFGSNFAVIIAIYNELKVINNILGGHFLRTWCAYTLWNGDLKDLKSQQKLEDWPVRRINGQRSWLNVLPHDDTPRRAVDMRHLHPPCAGIHPVQVVSDPVHDHALWWLQVEVDHVLRHASVQERSADTLHQSEKIIITIYKKLSWCWQQARRV